MALAVRRFSTRTRHEATVAADEFDALYRDALPRIYGYFLRRCGNDTVVAEDLTQETFVAAIRRLKQGDRIETPQPWLFAIARHKLIDHIRAASIRRGKTVDWDDVEVDALESQSETELTSWTQESVETMLPRLPEAQRIALLLHYMDDLPVPEVSRQIGRSIHANESLLARGRANLKRMLMSETEHRHV